MTNDIKGRRIVLVGGAGFIGHNLALDLVGKGAEVHIVDGLQVNNLLYFTSADLELKNRDLYLKIINHRLDSLKKAGVTLHVQDARDYLALTRIMNKVQPQVVIQLAAVSHAARSNKDPFSTFDHSLRTLENALDWSRDGIEQFIFLSSSMTYGNFVGEEVSEETPLNPIGIYAALKLAGEKLVIAYQQVFDMPYTIIRPSALYGPGCVSRRIGQIFIENAISGDELRIDGDGSERLDFTYIEDLIHGICLALTNPAARNQTFNLTYGQGRSIQELASIVQQHFPDVKSRNVERDKLMPKRGTLSIAKAKSLLGYDPKYPLETGIEKYVSWYRTLLESGEPFGPTI